MIKDNHSCD